MGKDPLTDIQNKALKADKLFKARAYKKAGKLYHKAANAYFQLNDYEMAKNCFLQAAECYIEMQKYSDALNLIRLTGEAYLKMEKYKKANKTYKNAVNLIPKLRNPNDRDFNHIFFPVISYLCSFLEMNQEGGLNFIKKFQGKVNNEYFKESKQIQMVTDLTIANRDNNLSLLERIIENISNLKFTEIEIKLLKKVLALTRLRIGLKSELELDKETYTTNDIIHLKVNLNTAILSEISSNSFFELEISKVKIINISANLSDNLAINKKPNLPLDISIDNFDVELNFILKPHFQLDKPYIGPISITFEVNDNLNFNYLTNVLEPELTSPPPSLKLSIKNLRPPLIGQSFPLEILLENESEGEALDVKVLVNFPDQLKIMRGTTEKQIYSLRSKEEMKWELNIKPSEVGDYTIKFDVKFKDSDQNLIEYDQEFPFSITM